jgi:hypothetical protein
MAYCRSGEHPLIRHNPDCVACALGKNRVRHNEVHKDDEKVPLQFSVGGAGPDDLTKVKLIVVSDLVGHYECLSNEPMHDVSGDREERKRGLLQPLNAGAFLRMSLNLMYGLDTYSDCYITNAVKCNPNQLKPLENPHMRPCASTWLDTEFHILDEYVPDVPILCAGSLAFKALCYIFKNESKQLLEIKHNNCRRRKDLKLGDHPLVVTFNPAVAARSMPKIETAVKETKVGITPTRNEWLFPQLPGSPVDRFIKDLYPLAPYLKK